MDRVAHFRNKGVLDNNNTLNSPTLDMLISAKRMGLISIVYDMCLGILPLATKRRWSKLVWEKAWLIEDSFWTSTSILHKDNDLLVNALTKTRYLTWWEMSDHYPNRIKNAKLWYN